MLGPPVLFPVYGWSVALARPGYGDHQAVDDADADVGGDISSELYGD